MDIVEVIREKLLLKSRTNIVYIHPVISDVEIAKYISAFSNDSGGIILFGVKDDGNSLLLKQSAFNIMGKKDKLKQLIDSKAKFTFGEFYEGTVHKLEYIFIEKNDEIILYNGAAYCLDTANNKPQIKKKGTFLFVTANLHEKAAFESYFKSNTQGYVLGKTYYCGQFGVYNAAYIHIDEQGITNPASTPLVGELMRKLDPVAVVMVGIAFGADEKKQAIGDVLVSKRILPYDSQKLLETETRYKESPKEVGFQLLNAFSDSDHWNYNLNGSKKSKVFVGAVLTGSKLINNYKYRTKLLLDFEKDEPVGGEMEAYGIYSMCRLHGVTEWIIIKGICDWGYNKEDPNKEAHQEVAAKAAADFCHHVFSRDGVFCDLIAKGVS